MKHTKDMVWHHKQRSNHQITEMYKSRRKKNQSKTSSQTNLWRFIFFLLDVSHSALFVIQLCIVLRWREKSTKTQMQRDTNKREQKMVVQTWAAASDKGLCNPNSNVFCFILWNASNENYQRQIKRWDFYFLPLETYNVLPFAQKKFWQPENQFLAHFHNCCLSSNQENRTWLKRVNDF